MPTAETELVHCTTAGGVATITLDSQRNRNALSRQLVAELTAYLDHVEEDDTVRIVVLAAEGPAFCAGADMSEAASQGMEEGARTLIALQRKIVAAGKPVVVRLHAPVRAGGLGLVGAADIVIAADTVTFAFTEARLALTPAAISLTTLPRLTSRDAARTFLTGETFDAREAARMGLVTQVVAPDGLDAAVDQVVGELGKSKLQGLQATKKLLNREILADIDARGDELAALSASLFGSPAAKDAMTAFLNRTKK
ncbi:enoyl-CoA hydratase-related protein [Leekyejoonella antrihumi]|uniref:Enoyl-CoA hydratase n=1 Tax=Leekyejoonella antrihumi TaxID=1660198 RepID=A0A563E3T7_9MICO|nr:enoyl-CoA hydratase-related protein [Leekyejoonella antrihumi]TWP37190.1 enoyl-CoA hydratase [Leekyejoonella antrihumi]